MKEEAEMRLLALYKNNFCDCQQDKCKRALQQNFTTLMKMDLNTREHVLSDMA
jgi:hypothetical protein